MNKLTPQAKVKYIAKFIADNNIYQYDLARLVGRSADHVSRVLSGKETPHGLYKELRLWQFENDAK